MDALILSNPLSIENTDIVAITDYDYNHTFGGKSPLNADDVSGLIQVICSGKPKAVVVDLDTSAKSFEKLRTQRFQSPIIWARELSASTNGEFAKHFQSTKKDEQTLMARGILGGTNDPSSNAFGYAIFPIDNDGTLRFYKRAVDFFSDGRLERGNTIAWEAAITAEPNLTPAENQPITEKLPLPLVKALSDLHGISVYDLKRLLDKPGGLTAWRSRVADKIIILGGSYAEARDNFSTAAGVMPGAAIIAQAIDGELQHKIRAPVATWLVILTEVMVGLALVCINCAIEDFLSSFLLLCLSPLIAAIASLAIYQLCYMWVSFVPVVLAVQLHAMFDHVERFHKLKERITHLEKSVERPTDGSVEKPLPPS